MKQRLEIRVQKCKRLGRSPFPRAIGQKHANKQGFPQTRGKKA